MKTKLLKIVLCAVALLLYNCDKKCDDCKDLIKKQKTETANTIEKGLDTLFQPFNDIRLPIFLGEKTNDVPQHLHIEGSIGNPFFIAGTFTTKNISTTECTISALKLEVIPSGARNAVVKNYKFDGDPTVTPDGNGGLNINVKIIEDSNSPSEIPNSASVTIKPITLYSGKIIDMHVNYTGNKNNFTFEDVDFEKCCAPVICKTIIHIINP